MGMDVALWEPYLYKWMVRVVWEWIQLWVNVCSCDHFLLIRSVRGPVAVWFGHAQCLSDGRRGKSLLLRRDTNTCKYLITSGWVYSTAVTCIASPSLASKKVKLLYRCVDNVERFKYTIWHDNWITYIYSHTSLGPDLVRYIFYICKYDKSECIPPKAATLYNKTYEELCIIVTNMQN